MRIEQVAAGTLGAYSYFGANKELYESREHQLFVVGGANTAKTVSSIGKCLTIATLYPGAQIAFIRKSYTSLNSSVIPTLKRMLADFGMEQSTSFYGNNRPEWLDFQHMRNERNGRVYKGASRIWFGGMDNAQKVLSSERDMIYCNQAEELSLNDWEYLTTRCDGRANNTPYPLMIGDCNPDHSKHWIKMGAEDGRWRLLNATHKDNPSLYDHATKKWTERGKQTIRILSQLTGERYKRLFLGQWVGREGMIYSDSWIPEIHIIKPFVIPPEYPRFWVIDFGYYPDPFVCSFFALTPEGKYIRYKFIYHTRKTVEQHANSLSDMLADGIEPKPFQIIADHDGDGRATLESRLGMQVTPAKKQIWDGIESVKSLLNVHQEGGAKLLFFPNDAGAMLDNDYGLVEEDEDLKRRYHPIGFPEETEGYIVNEKTALPDEKCPNHECDVVRYLSYTRETPYDDPGLLFL